MGWGLGSVAWRALLACALVGWAITARAQDIEPRAYSNAPIGVNFLVTGYAYTQGALSLSRRTPNSCTVSGVTSCGDSGTTSISVPFGAVR